MSTLEDLIDHEYRRMPEEWSGIFKATSNVPAVAVPMDSDGDLQCPTNVLKDRTP